MDPDSNADADANSDPDPDPDSDTPPNSRTDAARDTDAAALVRRYYDALDEHAYDALEDLLAPDFVQRRPDRTFDDRASFVQFMREGRPNPNTTHELLAVVTDEETVAARGRVHDAESADALFEFADFFTVDDGRIERLETYSR